MTWPMRWRPETHEILKRTLHDAELALSRVPTILEARAAAIRTLVGKRNFSAEELVLMFQDYEIRTSKVRIQSKGKNNVEWRWSMKRQQARILWSITFVHYATRSKRCSPLLRCDHRPQRREYSNKSRQWKRRATLYSLNYWTSPELGQLHAQYYTAIS